MDPEVTDKLASLVKHITETGEWNLDQGDLKVIKSYCKRSDDLVQVVFDLVMRQLNKKHAQIRYSSVQLIEQLFDRSKLFRDLLTDDFPLFSQLAVGIQDKKLPPPVQVATKLKDYALALIKAWYIKYGERYHQLGIAFEFLANHGYMNENSSSLSSIHASQRSSTGTDARKRANQFDRYNLIKSEVDNHMDSIKNNLDEMEGCFEILIPKNDIVHDDIDFESIMRGEASAQQIQNDAYKDDMLSHGLGSNRYKITIDLSEASMMDDVKETEENSVVFDQLREAFTVLETKHLKQLTTWINALAKIDVENKEEKVALLNTLVSLMDRASEESRKAKMLNIQISHREVKPVTATSDGEEDEYGDELFEDVDVPDDVESDKKKYGPSSSKLPPLQRIFPLSFEPMMIEDATYNGPTVGTHTDTTNHTLDKGKQKVDPEKEELLKRAPVVEWGEDLYYWDKNHVQFNTSGIEKSHRFMGVGEGDHEMPEQLLDDLRKRTIYYQTEAPKDIHTCKHPLQNGGLCPRRDLVTCPFHGRIVERDDSGQPINPTDMVESTSNSSTSHSKTPTVMDNLWELIDGNVVDDSGNPNLVKKSRSRSKKHKSSLINIKKKPATAMTRLQQKVNNPRMKKMVEESLEYEREMKSRNKEANNWQ